MQPTSYAKKNPSKRNPAVFSTYFKVRDNIMWRNCTNNLWIPIYDVVQTNGQN